MIIILWPAQERGVGLGRDTDLNYYSQGCVWPDIIIDCFIFWVEFSDVGFVPSLQGRIYCNLLKTLWIFKLKEFLPYMMCNARYTIILCETWNNQQRLDGRQTNQWNTSNLEQHHQQQTRPKSLIIKIIIDKFICPAPWFGDRVANVRARV